MVNKNFHIYLHLSENTNSSIIGVFNLSDHANRYVLWSVNCLFKTTIMSKGQPLDGRERDKEAGDFLFCSHPWTTFDLHISYGRFMNVYI